MATLIGRHANIMSIFYQKKPPHFLRKMVLKCIETILCKTLMWLLNFFSLKDTLTTKEH